MRIVIKRNQNYKARFTAWCCYSSGRVRNCNFGRHLGSNKNEKVIKNDLSEQRIKAALRAFKFNSIDIDEKQFGIVGIRLKALKELRKKITILKPDKGQGVVLLKQEDYTKCVATLLAG